MEGNLICVVCGNRVSALFRQYGPTVLKLTNCSQCDSIADKYIEYDPVIVMLDLVLLSKQAYRHVLYNTTFKAFWKLLIVLLLLDTYLDWPNDKFYFSNAKQNHVKHPPDGFVCQKNNEAANIEASRIWPTHSHIINKTVDCENNFEALPNVAKDKPKPVNSFAESSHNYSDQFFLVSYFKFFCVCCGMLVFTVATFLFSMLFGLFSFSKNKVGFILLLKALVLGEMGNLLILPALIWGGEHDTSSHSFLVWAYTMLACTYIHSVIFDCSKFASSLVLIFSSVLKFSVLHYLKSFNQTVLAISR